MLKFLERSSESIKNISDVQKLLLSTWSIDKIIPVSVALVSPVKGRAEGLISPVKFISSIDLDSSVKLDSAVVLIESV